jgi:hypothetical protein
MVRFLALYVGAPDSDSQRAWDSLSPDAQAARASKAMTAWGDWVQKHQSAIVDVGAPLGKTLFAGPKGLKPITNNAAAYVIVEAPDHQAAAAMFLDHPHFTLFPGSGVEIMPCLALPNAP